MSRLFFFFFISKNSFHENWNICDLIFGSCFPILAMPCLTELNSVKIVFLPTKVLVADLSCMSCIRSLRPRVGIWELDSGFPGLPMKAMPLDGGGGFIFTLKEMDSQEG